MSTRNNITTDIADRIAEILAENIKRGPLNYLYANRKRDFIHLKLAAGRVDYVIKEENVTFVISEVNMALERYWAKTKVTKMPAQADMPPSKYRTPEEYQD